MAHANCVMFATLNLQFNIFYKFKLVLKTKRKFNLEYKPKLKSGTGILFPFYSCKNLVKSKLMNCMF